MAAKTLIEKIETLPPAKKAEVENFVESLASRPEKPVIANEARDALFMRIHERRERLRREHGLFSDSTAIIRELRDSGS